MKHSVMLTITSLLSILLFTFHFADDIVRGGKVVVTLEDNNKT